MQGLQRLLDQVQAGTAALAEQYGKGHAAVVSLLAQRSQGAALFSDHPALLGQFQTGGGTGALARLDGAQHPFGVVQIEPGDAQALVQADPLQPARHHAGAESDLQRRAVELAGAQVGQGAVATGVEAAPQVDFVTGRQPRRIAIARHVGIATQPPFTTRAEGAIELRQQRRTSHARAGFGLAYASDGSGQIVVEHQSLIDQAIQLGIGETLPPVRCDLRAYPQRMLPLRGSGRGDHGGRRAGAAMQHQ